METIPLLNDIVLIFGLSIAVLLVGHRLKVPTVVGFILTGILAGPHGLGLVSDIHNVETFAQIGIVLLLFSIGMEFSIKKLLQIKRFFFVGGFFQVFLTLLGGVILGQILSKSIGESIFLGCLLAMSSTIISMRLLEEKDEVDSPHGRITLAIAIFQDLIAVPFILLMPLLAGKEIHYDYSFLYQVGIGILFLLFVFISANQLVPRLLYSIAKTRSRELFLMTVLGICLAVAWFSSFIGLSLSLGAFLAGLIISESEYSNEAIGDILPFQDIFTSFFFVSVGMLLDTYFVLNHWILLLLTSIGILLFKTFTAGFASLLVGLPLRTAVLAGIALSQIGEFSFVLAKAGMNYGLGSAYNYQLFLSVALITMTMSPYLISFSPFLANLALKLPLPTKIRTGMESEMRKEHGHHHHVIIIGYGVVGRHIAHSCRTAKVPYIVLEMNPDTVKEEKKKGEPIYFGDATHESVLSHVNIMQAKVVAVVINDSPAARRVVKLARRMNRDIYIIVRTRYQQDMVVFYQLGANDVIPDDFGSSVEVFTRVMNRFQIPHGEIEKIVSTLREEGYDLIRSKFKPSSMDLELKAHLEGLEFEAFRVAEGSQIAGKKIIDADLRKKYGVSVLLIRRENLIISEIDPETMIVVNDLVVLMGSKENLSKAYLLFSSTTLEGLNERQT